MPVMHILDNSSFPPVRVIGLHVQIAEGDWYGVALLSYSSDIDNQNDS